MSPDNIIQYFYYTIFLSYSIDELPPLYRNPGSAPDNKSELTYVHRSTSCEE
jgi:hypothetical protein